MSEQAAATAEPPKSRFRLPSAYAILLALVLIGMIAYARGSNHHRGDDVGALRSGLGVEAAT